MPENARRRTSRRGEVSQRDTYRATPGIEPAARPVDSYAPSGGGGNLRALQEAMKSGQNLVENYARYENTTNRLEKKEGADTAKRGEDPKEDATAPYLKGYYKTKGRAEAADFKVELEQYYQKNWLEDPETFRKGMEEIQKKYLQGRPEEYLEGFVPEATKAETTIDNKYQKAQYNDTLNTHLNNTAKSFSQHLDDIYSNEDISDKEKARKARQIASTLQKEAKALGLNREAVTERLVSVADRKGQLEANPEYLAFTREKGQGSGIRIIDTKASSQVRQAEQRAIQARQEWNDSIDARIEKQKEQKKANLTRTLKTRLDNIDPTNQVAVNQLVQDIEELATAENEHGVALSEEDYSTFHEAATNLRELDGFAEKTDPAAVSTIKQKKFNIETVKDGEQALELLNEHQRQFSVEDFQSWQSKIYREIDQMQDQGERDAKNKVQEFEAAWLRTLDRSGVGLVSIYGGRRRLADDTRQLWGQVRFEGWVEEFRAEHGRYPTMKEMEKEGKEIREAALDVVEDPGIQTGDGQGDKQSKDKTGSGQGKKSKDTVFPSEDEDTGAKEQQELDELGDTLYDDNPALR